ncbi:MAG: hypothetical protein IJB47_06635 [Oscillospiraceae bacterium]|nr:hypothetical protein [Oscillospiraceae bacterium]
MSIDQLQKQIRKLKNPMCVLFCAEESQIPVHIRENAGSLCDAYDVYARSLLTGLKETVPAVRFDFTTFAVLGAEGLSLLQGLLSFASEQGYYVILDAPEANSARSAQTAAQQLMNTDSIWKFDALVLSCYIGSDGVKPYIQYIKERNKALFFTLRTANKSALELQDLMTGSRLVHLAAADMAKRFGEPYLGRSGYSLIGGVGAATSADGLKTLRGKYPAMFLLIDGADYSGANAKNCSVAFDKLGHGAVACVGASILEAWHLEESDGLDYVEQAVQAAERIKKNLLRYITVL